MTIRTDLKAGLRGGGWGSTNHNETLAVRTDVKAGIGVRNHNETIR